MGHTLDTERTPTPPMSRDERRHKTATDVDNITLLSLCIGHTPDQTLRNLILRQPRHTDRHPQIRPN